MVPQRVRALLDDTVKFLKKKGAAYADLRWVQQLY